MSPTTRVLTVATLAASLLFAADAQLFLVGSGGRVMYRDNCDFKDQNDIYWVAAPASQCGDLCADDPRCTHWAWEGSTGGTCWMKGGTTGTISFPEGINCGYVSGRFPFLDFPGPI